MLKLSDRAWFIVTMSSVLHGIVLILLFIMILPNTSLIIRVILRNILNKQTTTTNVLANERNFVIFDEFIFSCVPHRNLCQKMLKQQQLLLFVL